MAVRSRSNDPDWIDLKGEAWPRRNPSRAAATGRHARSCVSRGREGKRSSPRRAGARGGRGGEADGDLELGRDGDFSSESRMAAAELGRGCGRRFPAQNFTGPCQKGTRGRDKGRGRGEKARGRRTSPETDELAVGNGGMAGMIPSSLGALGWCDLGQKEEEREGYKRVAVARALPSVVVRIEEGRPSGADGRAPAHGNGADRWVPRIKKGGKGRMRVGWSWAAACWAGPVGLARLLLLFFFDKTFSIICFSKSKQNQPRTFQKNLIKYFLKILFNLEHFGT